MTNANREAQTDHAIPLGIVGLGDRGRRIKDRIDKSGANFKVTAIADTNLQRVREYFAKHPDLKDNVRVYENADELFANSQDLEATYIATHDQGHKDPIIKSLDKGLHTLMEKPIVTNLNDLQDVEKAVRNSNARAMTFYTLKGAPFFTAVNDIANSGEIGNIYSVRVNEFVEDKHFLDSYGPGGAWGLEATSGPAPLTKFIHDIDMMNWIIGNMPDALTARAWQKHLIPENRPEDAAEECEDCESECRYDRFEYHTGEHTREKVGHPFSTLTESTDPEVRKEALRNDPRRQCAFNGNNDIPDTYNVMMDYTGKNGKHVDGVFTMTFGGDRMTRDVEIIGQDGIIKGDLASGDLKVTRYTALPGEADVRTIDIKEVGGHGGGDEGMVKSFEKLIRAADPNVPEFDKFSIDNAIKSHITAFAVDNSAKDNGQRIYLPRYCSQNGF